MDELHCTKCVRTVGPKYAAKADEGKLLYYVCKCGQRFAALKLRGLPPQVIHAGPQTKKSGPKCPTVVCSTCGGATLVKTQEKRNEYHWRRHECKASCGPMYSYVYPDGRVEVSKRLRSKFADLSI